jgi:hypothetical protein
MIWITVLVVICIWIIKECRNLHQFNYEGQIQEIHGVNSTVIRENVATKHPLLIYNVLHEGKSLKECIGSLPGYILHEKDTYISLDMFQDKEEMSLYQSQKLSKDLKIHTHLLEVVKPFTTRMTCHQQSHVSLFKGYHMTPVSQGIHDLNLVIVLSGSCILYLINPKHENEIQGKSNHQLKKWSHKIVLKPNSILSIPPQWFYLYECKGEVVISEYHSDTYGTYLYNSIR